MTETPRRRLGWLVATLAAIRDETPTARTLVLEVPEWSGHLAGQHLDVRLTAEDGYQAQRSYSIASPPASGGLELTVQRVADGEVSPYLLEGFDTGAAIELRGPVGRWFVWRPSDPMPVFLVAGGSGIVPLMAMIRTRRAARSRVPMRLLYSVRTPDDVIYADEVLRPSADGIDVTMVYTRTAPEGSRRAAARVSSADLAAAGWPPEFGARTYVCGPSGFVESVAGTLVAVGHSPAEIRTERFGPTG
ncbi:MAG TPA: ferredoxin reductase [Jatrophihabitantaceae bacterium]|nr:ferredoxin reductase [Jatrophihabitantaceae bacterium]